MPLAWRYTCLTAAAPTQVMEEIITYKGFDVEKDGRSGVIPEGDVVDVLEIRNGDVLGYLGENGSETEESEE